MREAVRWHRPESAHGMEVRQGARLIQMAWIFGHENEGSQSVLAANRPLESIQIQTRDGGCERELVARLRQGG
jgi:hypothetical protein